MTPRLTRSPGCAPRRSRAADRCTTLRRMSLNGGCVSMTEISGGTAAQPAASGQHDRRGREAALARAFVRLADTLASDFDVVDFLQGLCADAVEILEAEAAGVMLADPRGGLRLIASSDERMRLLELFELQGAQGPCLDAFSTGRVLQASAASSRIRWPVFAQHAVDSGFQLMCAVPLRVRTDIIGALNSRVVIEQAKAMIAEYLQMTVDDAFRLLRSYTRDHSRKLSDVARDVVNRKIPSTALGT